MRGLAFLRFRLALFSAHSFDFRPNAVFLELSIALLLCFLENAVITSTKLKSQLMKAQRSRSRSSKGKIRRDNYWSAEEGRLVDKIVPFCKHYLFPRYKFLRDNWMDYDPENENSFCHFVGDKMSVMYKNMRIRISGQQFKREWEDVYVPLIGLKYSNMRCNLSIDFRSQYFGKFKVRMISYRNISLISIP